jgi:hypothetical protein
MAKPVITTPRGMVFIGKNGKAELKWNSERFISNSRQSWNGRYQEAQKFVDSEVLRRCEPFTPLKTSMLIKSGILGTVIGSGLVSWIAPYARYQYYLPSRRASQTGALRGSFWFQRMKEVFGKAIVAGARKIAGGK